jgi:hypothetical protein
LLAIFIPSFTVVACYTILSKVSLCNGSPARLRPALASYLSGGFSIIYASIIRSRISSFKSIGSTIISSTAFGGGLAAGCGGW